MAIEIPGRNPARAAGGGDSWGDYLDPDETLLWQGAPTAGIRFGGGDVPMTLFGCVLLGFALFWIATAAWMSGMMAIGAGMGMASGVGAGMVVFPLFGLPFIAVGAYLAFGRLFWKAWLRRHTRYALTDRRAIIARNAWGRSLRSYPVDADTVIDFRPGREASIWFAEEERRGNKGRRYTVRHGFEFIPDGHEVYRLMRQIQRQAAARRGA